MNEAELKARFKRFAIQVFELTKLFPKEYVYINVEHQLIRCSSSSASNYHAACRGKSLADFINKLAIVEEETDETVFWLDYINGVDKKKWEPLTKSLIKEGNELISIVVTSIKTAKQRNIKLKTRY